MLKFFNSNKGISTPLLLSIVVLSAVILVGSIMFLQHTQTDEKTDIKSTEQTEAEIELDEILTKIKNNLKNIKTVHAEISAKEIMIEDDLIKIEEEFIEQDVDFISPDKKYVAIISKKTKEPILEIYVNGSEKKIKYLQMINYIKESGTQILEDNFTYTISNGVVNDEILLDEFLAEIFESLVVIFPDSNFLYYLIDLADEYSGPWSLTKSTEKIEKKFNDEIINGKDCYHYKVLVKRKIFIPYSQYTSLMETLIKLEEFSTSLKGGEIWVGKDDFLVYKEKYNLGYTQTRKEMSDNLLEVLSEELNVGEKGIEHSFPVNIKSDCYYEIIYSDFNKDIKIESPTENIMNREQTVSVTEEESLYNEQRQRDAIRKVDIRQIVVSLRMFYDQNGEYTQAKTIPLSIDDLLTKMPKDPLSGKNYIWIDNTKDSSKFCVYAQLEQGGYLAGSHKGTKTLDFPPKTLSCW